MKTTHLSCPHHIARTATRATGIGTRRSARGNILKLVTLLLALFGVGAGRALASNPVGIYALVDKVVFEPNETNPERIQVWGAFAFAEGYGYTYKNAERGYLSYQVNSATQTAFRHEWRALKA